MKKLFFALIFLGSLVTMHANLTGTGYYRVRNYGSSRWASLVDNKGAINWASTSADLHAISLTKDTETILSDPASIVLITNVSGNNYDVAAQGTSLSSLIDYPINIGADGSADGETLYRIYGTYSGVTRYIADGNVINSDDKGYATIKETASKKYMQWYILPVDVESDNFFGAKPSVTVGNNLYTTLFTSFAYQPYSNGVKAYYIGRVGFGMAEMIEISGPVPTGSPVIIQCAGENVADNKLKLVESEEALPNNALSGTYFNYNYNKNENRVVYDPATMRVLGTCSDGTLGFITADIESIPANTAYLVVPEGSALEFKCVSTSDYEANIPTAPEMFFCDDDSKQLLPQDDYTYTGTFSIDVEKEGNTPLEFYYYNGNQKVIIGPSVTEEDNVTLKLSEEQSLPFSYNSKYAWILPNWDSGEVSVSINILYQSITFYAKKAAVGSVIASRGGLNYANNTVYSDSFAEIKLFNITGQMVLQGIGNTLDVSSLPKGIYIAVANGESIKIVR